MKIAPTWKRNNEETKVSRIIEQEELQQEEQEIIISLKAKL